MSKNTNSKSKKSDVSSIKPDKFLQKLEFAIENLLNIVTIINLFQSPVMFDNKSQVNGDIQEPREIIEIIIKDLRAINTIIKFARKK
jgi:hypothetical protein